MKKLYEESEVQAIADAIRDRLDIDARMKMAEMPDYIYNITRNKALEANVDYKPFEKYTEPWVRPSEYEDLSELNFDDEFEVAYLSLHKKDDAPWVLGLYITASKGCNVEYGHIVNGEFVASYPAEKISNNVVYSKILPDTETNLVAKITNTNNLYPITYFSLATVPKAVLNTPVDILYQYLPVVERVGKLPYITSVAASSTNRGYGCYYLERDALKFGYNSSVTNLSSAWKYCVNLRQLEIDDIDTSHWKVTTLANMFEQVKSLEELDLSSWDTSNWAVTSLASAFIDSNFRTINLSGWNTTNWKVTTLASMFQNCYVLEEIDLTGWNSTNWSVTSLSGIFNACYSLKNIPIEHFNTANWKVTTIANLMSNCHSLTNVDLSGWNTTNWAVTTMTSAFQYCRNLEILKIDNWNTSNWVVATFNYLFDNCLNIAELDLSGWDTSNWPAISCGAFSNMRKLEKIDLTGWNTSKFVVPNTTSGYYFTFANDFSLKEAILPDLDFSNCLKVNITTNLFQNCYSLERVYAPNWKLPNVTLTMASMFNNCYNLREVDLSNWDTSNAQSTSIASMFQNCYSLRDLDISGWDVSNWPVTTAANMFNACYSLENVDLSDWNTASWPITTIASMFSNCYSLIENPIENWKTDNWRITTLNSLFAQCHNLKSIDLSKWNTANFALTDGKSLFDNCRIVEYVNVSSINQSSGTNCIGNAISPTNYSLTEFYPSVCTINQNYSALSKLSKESLLRILNTLPTVTGAHTLTLGNLRLKLSVTDIAIATSKGWTVA